MNDKTTKLAPLMFVAVFLAASTSITRAADEPRAKAGDASAQPGGASPQTSQTLPAAGAQAGAIPSQDANFILKAANSGHAEVELAKLAMERATSKPVREHARRTLEDHEKANEELRAIASRKKVPLPDQLTGVQRNLVEKLRAEEQADFEEAYIQAQVGEHKAAVALFRDEKSKGIDPDLREFASNQLPMLEKHLEEALTIADGLVQGARDRQPQQ